MIPPFVTRENGELVIRGANIVWYTMMVQGIAYAALVFYLIGERIIRHRRKGTRITLTTSNGYLDGDYERIL